LRAAAKISATEGRFFSSAITESSSRNQARIGD
jgi:hypothetical protein